MGEQVTTMLSLGPKGHGYTAMLAFAGSLDRAASKFWEGDV